MALISTLLWSRSWWSLVSFNWSVHERDGWGGVVQRYLVWDPCDVYSPNSSRRSGLLQILLSELGRITDWTEGELLVCIWQTFALTLPIIMLERIHNSVLLSKLCPRRFRFQGLSLLLLYLKITNKCYRNVRLHARRPSTWYFPCLLRPLGDWNTHLVMIWESSSPSIFAPTYVHKHIDHHSHAT